MLKEFSISTIFNCSPKTLYETCLSSDGHSKMTGGEAICSDQEGDSFSAWDGYISGKNIELVKNQKIVQSWRTSEFKDSDEDSKITITLKSIGNGCELILTHENISSNQPDYELGWRDHYFEPMVRYFNS